jgi:hypothetical protein
MEGFFFLGQGEAWVKHGDGSHASPIFKKKHENRPHASLPPSIVTILLQMNKPL